VQTSEVDVQSIQIVNQCDRPGAHHRRHLACNDNDPFQSEMVLYSSSRSRAAGAPRSPVSEF
jgi:hypothetical protein